MKTALVTTTINVPRVLALYRKLGPDVAFFVAADEKTPLESYQFCGDIPNCEIYSPDRQRELGYECSALLGWNNDSRRNIALLEAVKSGADIIVSIDDDMIPRSNVFAELQSIFSGEYSGIKFGVAGAWFDAGQFTTPPARQRGLPIGQGVFNDSFGLVSGAAIGAAQGIILGTPDTDAATTIAKNPFVHSASDVLRGGFVVEPQAFSVFNSQFTAFRRELAPAFAQFYKWQGRNTDIFAALIMRRVMLEHDLYTFFGPPVGFHARSVRNPFKDLQTETYGVERIATFADFLDACVFPRASTIENLRLLWRALGEPGMLDPECSVAALAFLNDMEKVL